MVFRRNTTDPEKKPRKKFQMNSFVGALLETSRDGKEGLGDRNCVVSVLIHRYERCSFDPLTRRD